MKLLTLITTLIITLASSNAFARTFVCENWVIRFGGANQEIQGTLFLGQRDGNKLIIKDAGKYDLTLTYFAKNWQFKYYSVYANPRNIRIYAVSEDQIKFAKDGRTELGAYDLRIAEIDGLGVFHETYCNYQ